jgi:uncharacterized RDD family membrane protein YckC
MSERLSVTDYPGYPNEPGGYPNQPPGYSNQPGGYPNQPPGGYPNQPGGYPNQPPGGYPYQPGGYPNQPPGYSNQPAAVPYANWGQRAGGYLIDVVPVAILAWIGVSISLTVYLLFVLVGLVYTGYNRWYLGGTTGQSFGKRALSLRLISEQTGQPIGPLMAFVRDICHILDTLACYVGWLFPLWDAKRQTFADKILNTIVIPA